MFFIDQILLIVALLLLIGIGSSKLSTRVGVPVLVLFLLVGMLAGSEGIGRIPFDNYPLAHGIATVSLAIILFDGGLRTPMASFRLAWRPALVLASFGVFATAVITGFAAAFLLGIPIEQGLLLGSIVGSTDAAAVFALLRAQGLNLNRRLASTLEVESGSNDPMAVFMTIGMIEWILGRVDSPAGMLSLFFTQMGVGAALGYAVGRLGTWTVNRIRLDSTGLYPILITGFGLLSFGSAAMLGGSGFLAVYISGLVIGNRKITFKNGVLLFQDGAAWLAQITLFVMLGMLSFPTRLAEAAPDGLIIAGVLIFVARPIAVAASVFPFRFNLRELTLLAWGGLKGAVPIVLASYPLLFGVPGGEVIFDVIFFVVLVSAVSQGWTLPLLARRLGLEEPRAESPPVTLEISSLRDVDGDIVEYSVTPGSRAANRLVRDLALPEVAVVAMVARGAGMIPPRGSTRILPGDHVFVVLRPEVRALVDRAFAVVGEAPAAVPADVEFPIQGKVTVAALREFYDIEIDAPGDWTLDQLLRTRLGTDNLHEDARIVIGGVALTIRRLAADGSVSLVGLSFRA